MIGPSSGRALPFATAQARHAPVLNSPLLVHVDIDVHLHGRCGPSVRIPLLDVCEMHPHDELTLDHDAELPNYGITVVLPVRPADEEA